MAGILAMAAGVACAQVGRGFTTIESIAGSAVSMQLGRIEGLDKAEAPIPEHLKHLSVKPYRLRFAASETIKGSPAPSMVRLVFLQHTHEIDFLKKHKVELLLAVGRDRLSYDPEPLDGLDPRLGRVSISLVTLAPISEDHSEPDKTIADSLNTAMNDGRMFGINLEVIRCRNELLKRARRFAAKHPRETETIGLQIPNDFAALVGYPNAYAVINLPKTEEVVPLLRRILAGQEWILKHTRSSRWPAHWKEGERVSLIRGALQCIRRFPSRENAALVRRYTGPDNLPAISELAAAVQGINELAIQILADWGMQQG